MLLAHVLSTAEALSAPAKRIIPDGRSIFALIAFVTTSSESASSVCSVQNSKSSANRGYGHGYGQYSRCRGKHGLQISRLYIEESAEQHKSESLRLLACVAKYMASRSHHPLAFWPTLLPQILSSADCSQKRIKFECWQHSCRQRPFQSILPCPLADPGGLPAWKSAFAGSIC